MRRPWVLIAAMFAVVAAAPARADVLISVDKSVQRMTVSVDGVPRYTWPVSTGRAGYGTPSGSFQTFRMEADHFSKEWDEAPMPNSIFFTRIGHAIHGSYDVKRLGTAVSHGCVRLAPANAATLFALVKEQGLFKTKVVLTGNAPAPAPAVANRKPLQLQQPQDNVQPGSDEETTGSSPPDTLPAPSYDPRVGRRDLPTPPADVPNASDQPVWGRPADGQQTLPAPEQPRPRWPFPFFN